MAASPALGGLRRWRARLLERGPREIVWSPQAGLGFGNMLYAYLYASRELAHGRDCRVLFAPVMASWIDAYPDLRSLTVADVDVQMRDRRSWVWRDHFGTDFTADDLGRFITGHLNGGPASASDEGLVVVNVRRGDYYDLPHFRGTYSFDIAGYLEIALARSASAAPISRVVFVSDGLDWCRLKLDKIAQDYAPEVSYLEGSPVESFNRVASSRRIVGTNSSFSYWASHVSDVVHGQRGHVVMPRFHGRLGSNWDAYQLDPSWDVVDDIPGGWNA